MGDDELRFYEIVAEEMRAGDLKPGLWTKAYADAGGEQDRARAFYIKLRVEQLRKAAHAVDRDRPPPARSVRWLKVWPALLVLSAVLSLVISLFVLRAEPGPVGLTGCLISLILFPIYGAIAVGLERRHLWAWKANWIPLIIGGLSYAVNRASADGTESFSSSAFTGALIGYSIVWALPNAIYFYKRRHLFHPAPLRQLGQTQQADLGRDTVLPGTLPDGTMCTHDGEESTYCTRCWNRIKPG